MKRDPKAKNTSVVNLGFQIAPMIDVVFVIMLFFMVMAGAVKVEKDHKLGLPVIPTNGLATPDEIVIRIEDDGQVYLNEDPVDSPEGRDLPELTGDLDNLRQSSVATKSDVFVTVDAGERTSYQRVMDVFDALSLARISQVTFTAGAVE